VDSHEEDLLDRAYERRADLLRQSGTRWVRMNLERSGVTLIVEETGGKVRREWLPRVAEPADGGAGNGEYDRE